MIELWNVLVALDAEHWSRLALMMLAGFLFVLGGGAVIALTEGTYGLGKLIVDILGVLAGFVGFLYLLVGAALLLSRLAVRMLGVWT